METLETNEKTELAAVPMSAEEKLERLDELQKSLEQIAEMNSSAKELGVSQQKTEQALRLYEAKIQEEAQAMIQKRRTTLQTSLAKDVKNASRRLESAKRRKTQAKDKQIKKRIAEEISGPQEQIKALKAEIKETLKANRMPRRLGRRMWYRMHMPSCIFDYVLLTLSALLFCGAIPTAIYYLIPNRQVWYFYLLLPLFILLYTLPYLHLLQKTKERYGQQLQPIKEKMLQIDELYRSIDQRTQDIQESPDESAYELQRQEETMNQAQEKLDHARAEQDRQLLEFEDVIRPSILKEFEEQSKAKVTELQDTITRLGRERALTEEMAAELHLSIVDKYEELFGAENLNLNRVKTLRKKLEEELHG